MPLVLSREATVMPIPDPMTWPATHLMPDDEEEDLDDLGVTPWPKRGGESHISVEELL